MLKVSSSFSNAWPSDVDATAWSTIQWSSGQTLATLQPDQHWCDWCHKWLCDSPVCSTHIVYTFQISDVGWALPYWYDIRCLSGSHFLCTVMMFSRSTCYPDTVQRTKKWNTGSDTWLTITDNGWQSMDGGCISDVMETTQCKVTWTARCSGENLQKKTFYPHFFLHRKKTSWFIHW